jgi:hypothetical protein
MKIEDVGDQGVQGEQREQGHCDRHLPHVPLYGEVY